MAGKQPEIASPVFLVFIEVTERGGFILDGVGNMHYVTPTLYCTFKCCEIHEDIPNLTEFSLRIRKEKNSAKYCESELSVRN